MTTLSIEEIGSDIPRLEALLDRGEEIQITRKDAAIGRIVPEKPAIWNKLEQSMYPPLPDFMARLKAIYGDRIPEPKSADIVRTDRDRY